MRPQTVLVPPGHEYNRGVFLNARRHDHLHSDIQSLRLIWVKGKGVTYLQSMKIML